MTTELSVQISAVGQAEDIIYKKQKQRKSIYLNILVTSIPTNMILTGNQTLINLHVRGSVVIKPSTLKMETITTATKFCEHKLVQDYIIEYEKLCMVQ